MTSFTAGHGIMQPLKQQPAMAIQRPMHCSIVRLILKFLSHGTPIDAHALYHLNPKARAVSPGESIQFEVLQGPRLWSHACYAWSVSGTSGATITQTGFYTAGGTLGEDNVTVIDHCNDNVTATAKIIVQVNDADGDGIPDAEDNCPTVPESGSTR